MAKNCHDCGARPGAEHAPECDVEQCPNCGGQFESCDCPARLKARRLPWPGDAECREFGWYCKLVPGVGWVTCGEDDPDAEPDVNRLYREALWDRLARRFVLSRRESRTNHPERGGPAPKEGR